MLRMASVLHSKAFQQRLTAVADLYARNKGMTTAATEYDKLREFDSAITRAAPMSPRSPRGEKMEEEFEDELPLTAVASMDDAFRLPPPGTLNINFRTFQTVSGYMHISPLCFVLTSSWSVCVCA